MTYGSFDYTSLLYLSDYLDDFGGGRFVFMEEGANKTVEPRAGRTHGRAFPGMLCLGCVQCVCGAHSSEEEVGVAMVTESLQSEFPEPAPAPSPVVTQKLKTDEAVILT